MTEGAPAVKEGDVLSVGSMCPGNALNSYCYRQFTILLALAWLMILSRHERLAGIVRLGSLCKIYYTYNKPNI